MLVKKCLLREQRSRSTPQPAFPRLYFFFLLVDSLAFSSSCSEASLSLSRPLRTPRSPEQLREHGTFSFPVCVTHRTAAPRSRDTRDDVTASPLSSSPLCYDRERESVRERDRETESFNSGRTDDRTAYNGIAYQ